MKSLSIAWSALLVVACSSAVPKPVAVDTRNDACASCRMALSDAKLAAELLAPGEEPRMFDDIGCLKAYLAEHPAASDVAIYVADHRTGAWVPARSALFTRAPSIQTPMGSHIVAHADRASRDADRIDGESIDAAELLGGTK